MPWFLNVGYLFVLVLLSPWLLYKAITTGKYRRGLCDKLLGISHSPLASSPSPLLFHGVSVGEIHLLRQVIAVFCKRHPERPIVISTTTDTGHDEAKRCFPDVPVIYFPFDFSWAVRRTICAVNPAMIVLAESEVWPNFLHAAREHGSPVAVINGRMSPRSFRRWQKLGIIARWLLQRVDLWAVQTEEYAQNLMGLGIEQSKVHVTGSVKYDGAATDCNNPRTTALRGLFGIGPNDLIWIAGSTQEPEEEIVLRSYQRLRAVHPTLRLFLVPRQKDRFEEVARMLERINEPFIRRSSLHSPFATRRSPLVLMDTIGELGALWGLADVAFVGGSMDGRRGGQNMIEPAAYGAPVVFGPHVWNFQDAANRLLAAGAACQVQDAVELEATIGRLLADQTERAGRGRIAQEFVLAQQGATQRTLDLLDTLEVDRSCQSRVA